jgi:hypothetical protein
MAGGGRFQALYPGKFKSRDRAGHAVRLFTAKQDCLIFKSPETKAFYNQKIEVERDGTYRSKRTKTKNAD